MSFSKHQNVHCYICKCGNYTCFFGADRLKYLAVLHWTVLSLFSALFICINYQPSSYMNKHVLSKFE